MLCCVAGNGKYEGMDLPLEKGVTLVMSRSDGKSLNKLAHEMMRKRKDVKLLIVSSRTITALRRNLVSYRYVRYAIQCSYLSSAASYRAC